MSDEKKPPEFDPDKTVVEVRRPGAGSKPAETPKPAPPAEDSDRTVVMTRKPAGATPQDADRTVVTPRAPQAGASRPGDLERTMVGRAPGPQAEGRAGAAAEFQLACLSGPDRGRRFSISGAEVVVGSNPSCNVILKGAAPIHAKLAREGETYAIQNLGPSGSVIVRGRAPSRATLKTGDLLKIGDAVLRFVRAGEVFSSEFSEDDLKVSGIGQWLSVDGLKQRPMIPVAIVLALVVAGGALYTLRSPKRPQKVVAQPAPAEDGDTDKEVSALLVAGELLYNEGRYVAPPDRPDLENAYAKFNQVLSIDPGNEDAREWLRKIDVRLEELRREREEAEKKRREAEQARLAAQRLELQEQVRSILAKGDELFDQGKVAEPVGRNALVFYRQALEVDPESPEAKERVRRGIYYHV
ncbi:MAG: FHA domain-containing protein, partial [Candidatus Binatia bacterium]